MKNSFFIKYNITLWTYSHYQYLQALDLKKYIILVITILFIIVFCFREVVIDDILRKASNSPPEVEVVPWEQLVLNVFKQMGHSYKVELGGSQVPLTKGKLPPIDIQVGTRSGNKKVSKWATNNISLNICY